MTKGGVGPDRWTVEKAVKASALPAPSRLILLVLLTRTDNGTAIVPAKYAPSLTTLASETGLSRRTVMDHLNRLETDGWLDRQRPSTREALASRARTGYRIGLPGRELHQGESCPSAGAALVDEEPQVGTRAGAAPGQEMPPTRAGAAPNPTSSQPSSPSEKKGGVGGNKRPKADDEHPRFGEFYAAYPKKADPADARRAFNKAIKKVSDPQILIDGARRYAREKAGTEKRYIKAPAVWLNKESWLNEPDAPLGATGTDGIPGYGARAAVNDIEDWTIRT